MMRRFVVLFCLLVGCGLPSLAETARWSASTASEFELGTFEGTALNSDGEISVARERQVEWGPESGIVWGLLADDRGGAFVALSSPTRLLYIDDKGESELWFSGDDDSLITAVTGDGAGGVYIGLSPQGQLLHVESAQQSKVLVQAEVEYIWALARDLDGAVWLGTGNPGGVARYDAKRGLVSLWDSGSDPVRRLIVDDGVAIAGTGKQGRVVRVSNSGDRFVLLDLDEAEIVGLVADTAPGAEGWYLLAAQGSAPARPRDVPDGATYVRVTADDPGGATPKDDSADAKATNGSSRETPRSPAPQRARAAAGGRLYRLDVDGSSRALWGTGRDIPFDLAIGRDGLLWVATGEQGRLWSVEPVSRVIRMMRIASNQASAVAAAEDGAIWVGGTADARVERIGAKRQPEGKYVTRPIDAGAVARWGELSWNGEGDPIQFQVRRGNTVEPDDTWSDWKDLKSGEAITPPNSSATRYLQARAILQREARLRSMSIAYRALNRAPSITSFSIEPPGLVVVPGPQANSAGMSPVVADDPVARQVSTRLAGRGRVNTRRGYAFGARTFKWSAQDADGDRLRYTLELRREGEQGWIPISTAITDEYYSWDTRSVPDGRYRLRLTVDDRLDRDATESGQDQRLSDLMELDNTRPQIVDWSVRRGDQGFEIRFSAIDPGGELAAAEWTTDGVSWTTLEPTDGLTDSDEELFSWTLATNADGPTSVRVRLVDRAGNVSGSFHSF